MANLPPQKFLTLTAAPPSAFLSLAPATSASYPKKQSVRSHSRVPSIPSEAVDVLPRRSSSVSTASSSSNSGNSYRILKLGPVHWGEHLDEHKADFHDVILS